MRRCILWAVTLLPLLVRGGPAEAAGGPAAEAPSPQATERKILLQSARVFDSSAGSMSEPQDILIVDRSIAAVGPDLEATPDAERIDCSGKYVVPGLFDSHVHLAHLTTAGGDTLRFTLAEFVRRGITHVRDVGGPLQVLRELERAAALDEISGPEIFYAGPMLEHAPLTWERFNFELPGFTVAVDSIERADSVLTVLSQGGARFIKTFNKQDPVVYRHMLAKARELSLRVVHDPGGPLFHAIPMDSALVLGVTSIEHAKSPWPVVLSDDLRREHDAMLAEGTPQMQRMGLLMKAAGLGVASVSEDRLRQLALAMKERGGYLCPTLFVLTNAEKEAIAESKRQMGVDSLPEPAQQMIRSLTSGMAAVSRHFVHEFAGYGVRMLVGQDGAEPTATFREMRLMQEAGVPEAEIIRGATLYPSQWLGVDDRLGSVAAGREADLVVINGDPLADIAKMESTYLVIRNGRIIRSPAAP